MLESQYSSRRDILHSSIRKEAIRTQIRQVRQDLLAQQKNSLLDSIINDGLQNNEQLNTLIYFANQDQSNAIIYLGNLLIDGAITPEIIASRIHPSKNDYWCWLIRVLYSCRYCEIAHIQYILDKMQSKKTAPSQQFSHYKSMNSVYSTIQCLGFIEILLHDQEKDMINIMLNKGDLVKSLLNLTTHQRKQIYSSSIRIINKIIGFDSYSAQIFINEYLQKCPTVSSDPNISKKIQTSLKMKNLAKYVQKIFLKADPKLRAIGYQIMTNLCLNGVVFVELSKTPFIVYEKQKQIVKIEISYYFLELVKNCSDEDLRILLDNSFAAVLKNIYLQEKTKQIKTNIYESLLVLKARIRKLCLEGTGEHMWKIIERLCLDSLFKQRTMEEQ